MLLEPAELSASGRLVLRPGEFEKGMLDLVDLDNVQGAPGAAQRAYKGGDCILTNLRLVWRGSVGTPAAGAAVGLPLAAVHRVRKDMGFGFAVKVKLELTVAVDHQSRPSPGSADLTKLTLKSKGSGVDAFKATLDTLLSTRSWQLPAAVVASPPSHPIIPTASTDTSSPAPSPTTSVDGPPTGPPQWQPLRQHQPKAAGWRPLAHADPPAAPQPPAVNMSLVNQLQGMGFPRNTCIRAVQATGGASLQAGLDFILAYGDQPGMDDPLPPPGPPAAHSAQQPPPARAPYDRADPRQGYYSTLAPSSSSSYPAAYSPYANSTAPSPSWGAGGLPPSNPMVLQNPLLQQLQPPRPPQPQRPPASLGGPVGVGALLQKQAQQQAETNKSLESAFKDLGALMAMAQQMVALAEKFRGVAGAGEATGGGDLVDVATQQELVALGIPSPVTRESAGAKYHEELARQLADFLLTPPPAPSAPNPARAPARPAAPLARAGGVLPLPDVYCLLNRARGSELVSPDDLLQCAALFPRLGIPLQLRRFASGVIVLQTAAHSDAQVAARIAELARPAVDVEGAASAPRGSVPGLGPPLTASDVARAMGVPLTIAAEHLATAEQLGTVCRDDGPEGLRFFRNFFKEARPMAV